MILIILGFQKCLHLYLKVLTNYYYILMSVTLASVTVTNKISNKRSIIIMSQYGMKTKSKHQIKVKFHNFLCNPT